MLAKLCRFKRSWHIDRWKLHELGESWGHDLTQNARLEFIWISFWTHFFIFRDFTSWNLSEVCFWKKFHCQTSDHVWSFRSSPFNKSRRKKNHFGNVQLSIQFSPSRLAPCSSKTNSKPARKPAPNPTKSRTALLRSLRAGEVDAALLIWVGLRAQAAELLAERLAALLRRNERPAAAFCNFRSQRLRVQNMSKAPKYKVRLKKLLK